MVEIMIEGRWSEVGVEIRRTRLVRKEIQERISAI